MRRSTAVLIVLLGASILANAMLFVRLSRKPEAEPAVARKHPTAAQAAPKTDDPAQLRDALDQERKKNDELRAKIDRLETDKKVLAQDPHASAGKGDKLASFKEKLRKLMKVMKDPAAKAGAVDPDSMVELTETMMEFFKMAAMRTKDPKTYAGYLQAFYEIGLEGETTALTEAQSSTLAKLFEDFGVELGKVPPSPAGDRLLKEIEIEAATMTKVRGLLTEAQRTALSKDNMDALAAGNMMSMQYVGSTGAADQIAQTWTALYQLDPSQLQQAKVAAQAYVDAMNRINADKKNGGAAFNMAQSGSPEGYAYRLQSVREQLAALNLLQASMTPAQQERLRTQSMREILIMDMGAGVTITAPADK